MATITRPHRKPTPSPRVSSRETTSQRTNAQGETVDYGRRETTTVEGNRVQKVIHAEGPRGTTRRVETTELPAADETSNASGLKISRGQSQFSAPSLGKVAGNLLGPLVASVSIITYRSLRTEKKLPPPGLFVSVGVIYGGLATLPESAGSFPALIGWGFVVAALLKLWPFQAASAGAAGPGATGSAAAPSAPVTSGGSVQTGGPPPTKAGGQGGPNWYVPTPGASPIYNGPAGGENNPGGAYLPY